MARDIKMMIGGNVKRAQDALRELQRTGHDVSNRLERDFSALGTESSTAFDNKRKAAVNAYDRIKRSGTATADELVRAEEGLSRRLKEIDKSQYGERITLAEKFRANWVKITAAAAAAGYASYRLARRSIEEYQSFETSLTDLGKVTGESLESVREKIMALPPELGSATELVKGYYQAISAGVTKPKEAMDLLIQASKMAKAAHIEQDTSIRAITKLMAGFGDNLDSAREATDLLMNIEQYGQTTVEELSPVVGKLASISNQLKVMPGEMGAFIAQLSQTAGSTAQAATQYENILSGLMKPTKSMLEVFEQLGVDSAQQLISEDGLAGALVKITKQAKTAFGENGLGKIFESKEALTGLGPLMEDEFSKVNEVTENLAKNAGSTEEAFQRWKGTFEAVKQTFDNTIGKVLIELGQELAPTVMEAMKSLSDWIRSNRSEIIDFIEGVGSLIGTLTSAAKGLYNAVGVVAELAAEASLLADSQFYQAERETRLNPSAGLGRVANRTQPSLAQQTVAADIENLSGSGALIQINGGGNTMPGLGSSISAPFGAYSPGFAVGSSYVPANGYYRLHRGEEVRNRSDVRQEKRGSRQSQTMNVGDINLNFPNVTQVTKDSARDFARMLFPELKNLESRFRHA